MVLLLTALELILTQFEYKLRLTDYPSINNRPTFGCSSSLLFNQ